MTLNEFPLSELVKVLVEKQAYRKEYFSRDPYLQFKQQISKSLKTLFLNKERHALLINEYEKITKTNKVYTSNEELKLRWAEQIENTLSALDLTKLEFSNQTDIDVIQDVTEKCNTNIEELALLKSLIVNNPKDKFSSIIDKFSENIKLNQSIWNSYESRFSNCLTDEVDNIFVDEVIQNNKMFYSDVASALEKALDSPEKEVKHIIFDNETDKNGDFIGVEKISSKPKVDELIDIIESFESRQKDLIIDLDQIKIKYDENLEDVNFDRLLRKVYQENKELLECNNYELMLKINYLLGKIEDSKEGQDLFYTKYSHKPEIDNLALITDDVEKLRVRLIDCYNILNGDFIKGSNSEIFVSLFEKDRFIAPIEWLGTNKELNYFILEIADNLLESRNFWPSVRNCFVRNGEKMGEDSVRKHNTPKPIADNSKLILDKAIKSLIY